MKIVFNFILFTFALTIFSQKLGGFEIYPAIVFFPIGVYESLHFYKISSKKYSRVLLELMCFVLVVFVSSLTKPYLLVDLFKLFYMGMLYQALVFLNRKKLIEVQKIFVFSLSVLVIYGCLEFLGFAFGFGGIFSSIHNLLSKGVGTPFDIRGGIPRVASLTWEPSYFAFTVGISFFLVQKRWQKVLCGLGVLVSFSLITAYAMMGVLVFVIWKKFRLSAFSFLMMIVLVHIVFVFSFLEQIPALVFETFRDRYGALAEIKSFGWVEFLFGGFDVSPNSEAYLYRPLSNIGSVVYLFGFWGVLFYVRFFSYLEEHSKYAYAAIAMFLYMFNYYYLTSWPIIVFMIFLMLNQEKESPNEVKTDV